ncbi:MAG: zinc ribbon domain-containing protein [Acidobacteria bacterium]|nr:MAG: zinc ribbon domain-containing protein [Acidobacteriota bacterium]REK02781.1 MAG: zinc ribbon domain-containing protein [Acidobacteriota bacterium]REK13414.1 MAG: zinc ribbon domain-containing protein [Acidobacteriota bacterium]REK41408.1 MAG: zinc ribbon domain-containing protein [Acidobacteriota bacterium]
MFCPKCGNDNADAAQYCRSCGGDLAAARNALNVPQSYGDSADVVRLEIGKAIGDRIRTANKRELSKIAEEILPEVEKFLEGPEERRMRRFRIGSTLSLIGVGAFIGFLGVALFVGEEGIAFLAAMGLVTLFIGLAFFINGYFLTVPKGFAELEGSGEEKGAARSNEIDANTNELLMPQPAREEFTSVTEGTTRNLVKKKSEQ